MLKEIDDDDREERFVRLFRDLQPKIAGYVPERAVAATFAPHIPPGFTKVSHLTGS